MVRFNPFRGLPNPREVWAWGMYDLANQSFQLLVNTLLFGIYIAAYVAPQAAAGAGTQGEAAWGKMGAAQMILVLVASPILGAIGDARALRREFLLATGFGAVVLTCALAFAGPGMLAYATAVYIAAAFLVGIGENFLGSFLPQLATRETMGKVSAIGWSMSYLGALILLGLTAVVLFGLNLTEPRHWRWIFVGAGVWFLLGMLPTVFYLRERLPPARPSEGGSVILLGLRELRGSLREARRYTQLIRFLSIFFVYSMGTLSVVFFAGLIGKSFGFDVRQLTLLAVVMSLTAGGSAIFAARHQDSLGHRRTIRIFLAVWVVSTLALAIMEVLSPAAAAGQSRGAPLAFWFISAGIGIGLGGIGTASRAMVGLFTPGAKAAEFFGLWGMVYRLGGIVGVLAFSQVRTRVSAEAGLFLLTLFFGAGLVLMGLVDEEEGMRQAQDPAPAEPPATA